MAELAEITPVGILVPDPELGEAMDLPYPGRRAPHGKAYHR